MRALFSKKIRDNSKSLYSLAGFLLLIAMVVTILALLSAICLPSTLKDVKYNDVIKFLEKDATYKNPYQPGEFVCWDFAKRLQTDATESGIRCAVVTLAWAGSDRSHVINAFTTVDKGMIWVDATGSHSKNVAGHYQIQIPQVEGDKYLYVEIGGDPPEEVTLNSVAYNWHPEESDTYLSAKQLILSNEAVPTMAIPILEK
jgi:hypothetical protein